MCVYSGHKFHVKYLTNNFSLLFYGCPSAFLTVYLSIQACFGNFDEIQFLNYFVAALIYLYIACAFKSYIHIRCQIKVMNI